MKPFANEEFLLETRVSAKLFHEYAEHLPIIDYHCHVSPREVAENRRFGDLAELWLGGDHYKWRAMRSAGVEERLVTGDAPPFEKFSAWAEVLPRLAGCPLYHWSHLEIRRYFGFNKPLTPETARELWDISGETLKNSPVREIIRKSNVELLCTTDDPADALEFHESFAAENEPFKMRPAWRPDKAMNIETPGFTDYLTLLGKIASFKDLKKALRSRMDYFAQRKCSLADHGLLLPEYAPAPEEEIERVFAKRLAGETLAPGEVKAYETAFLTFCAEEYAERGWVMQLHYGCLRGNNSRMTALLGPDTGFDAIENRTPIRGLARFLDALDKTGKLPKTIIYSLNPNDDAVIDGITACFNYGGAAYKVQHGSAWWFNDHKSGMENQLRSLMNFAQLPGFVGMLTDSRCFISYPRHEYFRRILCNMLGKLVENGEYPEDYKALGELVRGVCYENAVKYFGFGR